MTITPPPVIRDTVPLSDMEPWRREFVLSALAAEQEELNAEATDPERAHLVTLTSDCEHFNGDVVIERFGTIPTHWMPVPVAKKAGA
jgi:hypothetical protein